MGATLLKVFRLVLILATASFLAAAQTKADNVDTILQPYIVVSCGDISHATEGKLAKFAVPFRGILASCQRDQNHYSYLDRAALGNAIAYSRPRATAANVYEVQAWDADAAKCLQILVEASSRNIQQGYAKPPDADVPSFTDIGKNLDPAVRVDRLFHEFYLRWGDPDVFAQENARILANDYKSTGKEYDTRKVVVLTCFDLVRVLSGRALRVGVAMEPLLEPCYESANRPIVISDAQTDQNLTKALTADAGLGPALASFADANAGFLVKNLYVPDRNFKINEANRQAAAAKKLAEEEQSLERQQAERAAIEAKRQAQVDAEEAERKRWNSLTPQQQAAENQAARERQQIAFNARCEQMRALGLDLNSRGMLDAAAHIISQMQMLGCSF